MKGSTANVGRRMRGHRGTERDSASALELEPERVDIAIVMQTHAGPASSVHQKEK